MSSPSALNCFADADMMSYRTILAEGGRAALPLHAGATQTLAGRYLEKPKIMLRHRKQTGIGKSM